MDLEYIKKELETSLKYVESEIYRLQSMDKPPKINENKYLQRIYSKLRVILGNPIENPIMKIDEAEQYYFNIFDGLQHIQEKYILILELQEYIVEKTDLPFVYDRYLIQRILQVTQTTYNIFIEECLNGINARDEDIANIFEDIETMIISDRNNSAELGTRNAKAVDNVNKYKRASGGFGILSEKENKNNEQIVVNMSVEEVNKKLNTFAGGTVIDIKEEK